MEVDTFVALWWVGGLLRSHLSIYNTASQVKLIFTSQLKSQVEDPNVAMVSFVLFLVNCKPHIES